METLWACNLFSLSRDFRSLLKNPLQIFCKHVYKLTCFAILTVAKSNWQFVTSSPWRNANGLAASLLELHHSANSDRQQCLIVWTAARLKKKPRQNKNKQRKNACEPKYPSPLNGAHHVNTQTFPCAYFYHMYSTHSVFIIYHIKPSLMSETPLR